MLSSFGQPIRTTLPLRQIPVKGRVGQRRTVRCNQQVRALQKGGGRRDEADLYRASAARAEATGASHRSAWLLSGGGTTGSKLRTMAEGQAAGQSGFCCRCRLDSGDEPRSGKRQGYPLFSLSLPSGVRGRRLHSKASASASTTFSAPSGHSPRQAPRPSQYRSATSLALAVDDLDGAFRHSLGTHKPQPLHLSSSIWMIFRIVFMVSFLPSVWFLCSAVSRAIP